MELQNYKKIYILEKAVYKNYYTDNITSMDLVEISPRLDINDITSWLGLKLLYEIFYQLKVICIFICLVFIEIIQLNFFGLSKMTQKNIELRARHDSDLIHEMINDLGDITR